MGLKSEQKAQIKIDGEFAPCMGLKRISFVKSSKYLLFAPCMGLKSIIKLLLSAHLIFAPCMGLKRLPYELYELS